MRATLNCAEEREVQLKNYKSIRAPKLRHGQKSPRLDEKEFKAAISERFFDPNFQQVKEELAEVIDVAWQNYKDHRKAPLTSPAGAGFADPNYALSDQWREAADKLKAAQKKFKSKQGRSRILLINASPRSEHTCPGEVSKSFVISEKITQLLKKNNF